MRIKAKLFKLKLDKGKFTRRLHCDMSIQLRQAARAFVRTILVQDLVPVWTGMARGSLIPLARYLTKVSVPARPTRSPRPKKYYGPGPGAGALQTEALGKKLGAKAFKFLYGSPQRPIFCFEFHTDVYHYILADTSALINTGPWHSFALGSLAFQLYANTEILKKLPKIKDFIQQVAVRIG